MSKAKQVMMRPKKDIHYFEKQKKHIVNFIIRGSDVEVTVMFRKEEIPSQTEFGLDLLNLLADELSEIATVEAQPTLYGRNMTMIIKPGVSEALGDSDRNVRKSAAEVFHEIGDLQAGVPPIGRAQKGTSEVVSKSATEALGESTNPQDGEYYDRCLKQAYFEEKETRTFDSDPAFNRALDPLNRGDYSKACEEAEKLVEDYRDFDTLYFWWGRALLRTGSHDRARQIACLGLDEARRKYSLCELLGEVEWDLDNIKEAVYWWAQALHCQEPLDNCGGEVGAYLYLYYVADGMRLPECAEAFLLRVDRIRSGEIRLAPEFANNLRRQAAKGINEDVQKVMKALVEKYIIPKRFPKRKTEEGESSGEVDHLIGILEHEGGSGWTKQAVDAANTLGDIGDPRAIIPLTKAAQHVLLDLSMAAREAIEKIEKANK